MTKNKNIHSGHRSRIRERVQNEGLGSFQDYQVLEYALSFVIPYKDTNPIAHALINKFGSIVNVLEADIADLSEVDGMGEVSAQFLNAILQIYHFYENRKKDKHDILNNSLETYEYARKLFIGKHNEELYMLSMLPNNKVIKVDKICEGTQDRADVAIRKISEAFCRNKVSRVILVHNHPNGEAKPSISDDELTKAVYVNLSLNRSVLLDHMIIGDNGYFSYNRSDKLMIIHEQVKDILGNKVIAQPIIGYGERDEKKR